jgi:ketosteroid isomerase-like protein
MIVTLVVLLLTGTAVPSAAQDDWSPQQRQVLAAIGQLSAATAPDGGGPDAYAAVLADDFSRWTLGGDVVRRKTEWVESVRGWFNDGWRVADRKTEHVEIVIRGDLAFTRRIVTESFVGPDGERPDPGSAALAEVWVREGGEWLLLRVDAHPLERD